jgi:hypothetical protein
MAISHICLGCGIDLARVRPAWGAPYALPLVICPGCGRAAVRRLDPLVAGWRQGRRIVLAVTILLVQIGAALLLLVATTEVSATMSEDLARHRIIRTSWLEITRGFRTWMFRGGWVVLAAAGVLAVAAGVWLGATLRHLRARSILLGWTLAILVMFLLVQLLRPDHPHGLPGPRVSLAASQAALLCASVLLTGAALPLGMAITHLVRPAAAHHRARRRARRRRRRQESP